MLRWIDGSTIFSSPLLTDKDQGLQFEKNVPYFGRPRLEDVPDLEKKRFPQPRQCIFFVWGGELESALGLET